MKKSILALVLVVSANAYAALSPASQFVHDTLTTGQAILELQDGEMRFSQMCDLISTRFHKQAIANVWLGDYGNLGRDQASVAKFPALVPAILIGKVFGDLTGSGGKINGTFAVAENPVDRGQGILEVSVTLTSAAGRNYQGNAILRNEGGNFRAIDIEYMGMSAVDYQGQQFQDVMKEEYEKDVNASLPVTALIEQIESDSMYKACP